MSSLDNTFLKSVSLGKYWMELDDIDALDLIFRNVKIN